MKVSTITYEIFDLQLEKIFSIRLCSVGTKCDPYFVIFNILGAKLILI